MPRTVAPASPAASVPGRWITLPLDLALALGCCLSLPRGGGGSPVRGQPSAVPSEQLPADGRPALCPPPLPLVGNDYKGTASLAGRGRGKRSQSCCRPSCWSRSPCWPHGLGVQPTPYGQSVWEYLYRTSPQPGHQAVCPHPSSLACSLAAEAVSVLGTLLWVWLGGCCCPNWELSASC